MPVKGYRIDSRCLGRGKRASGANWKHESDVDARQTRLKIEGLKPDTIYLLRVCAVNEVGLSLLARDMVHMITDFRGLLVSYLFGCDVSSV